MDFKFVFHGISSEEQNIFFNTLHMHKKNFGFWPINVEISLIKQEGARPHTDISDFL
jgi:hypothetical protein